MSRDPTSKDTIICEYIIPNGLCERIEFLRTECYCNRVLMFWEIIQHIVGSRGSTWPKYIWELFWKQSLTKSECGQMAGFVVLNNLQSGHMAQWFGLVDLKKSNRHLVYSMIEDLLKNPENYSFVFAYHAFSDEHVYLDGTPSFYYQRQRSGTCIDC